MIEHMVACVAHARLRVQASTEKMNMIRGLTSLGLKVWLRLGGDLVMNPKP